LREQESTFKIKSFHTVVMVVSLIRHVWGYTLTEREPGNCEF